MEFADVTACPLNQTRYTVASTETPTLTTTSSYARLFDPQMCFFFVRIACVNRSISSAVGFHLNGDFLYVQPFPTAETASIAPRMR